MDPEFRAQQERLRALRAEPVPAIIIAARDGDVDALRRELDLGVSVDLADAWKSTPLQVACGKNKEVSEETGLLVPSCSSRAVPAWTQGFPIILATVPLADLYRGHVT